MDLVEMNAGEPRHPWEEARGRFFVRLLGDEGLLGDGVEVLDAGAGDGWFARQLAAALPPAARVACWDTGYTPEVLDRVAKGAPVSVTFSRERPAGRFGLILLMDVLEHVPDDRGFLERLASESLAPGGRVLVTVPAWPALSSAHDEALRHVRRYRPGGARSLLGDCGLEPIVAGGLFASLLPVRGAQALANRLRPPAAPAMASGGLRGDGLAGAVVRGILSWDARASLAAARLGLELPGLSWWALCRKSR
jgi:SAM-dependent methyltransferase